VCSRVATSAFLKAGFVTLAFFEHLWLFFEIKKARKIWLGSGKTFPELSELHIHYKYLATRVYYHAGCTEYCKNFTAALNMIDVIDEKQMHDSVITGKEYASKDWTCVISMFLTSFNVYSVCGCACFVCIYLKTYIWFFGTRSGFFGEDRLVILLCSLARFDPASRGVRQSVQPHTYARLLIFDQTLAQPHFAVVNCSDAMMSVFYSPFSTRSQNFAVMNSCVAALSLISSDILTWSADSLYSVQ